LEFLNWIASTDLATWIGGNDWAYPILLTLHAIGMGVVVGIMIVLDFRTLGLAPNLPMSTIEKFFPLAWAGFFVNLGSGTLLFIQDAPKFAQNAPFQIKIALIILGGVSSWILVRTLRAGAMTIGSATAIPPQARPMAAISLAIWIGAIVSGRLIAYIHA
jgi:hypothetical protein